MTLTKPSLSYLTSKVTEYIACQLKLHHYLTLLSLIILFHNTILPPGIGLVQLLFLPILFCLWTKQGRTMAPKLLTGASFLLFLLTLVSLVMPRLISGRSIGDPKSLFNRALRLSRTTHQSTTSASIKSKDRKLLTDNMNSK